MRLINRCRGSVLFSGDTDLLHQGQSRQDWLYYTVLVVFRASSRTRTNRILIEYKHYQLNGADCFINQLHSSSVSMFSFGKLSNGSLVASEGSYATSGNKRPFSCFACRVDCHGTTLTVPQRMSHWPVHVHLRSGGVA